jgi:hypothetical protein
MPYKLVKVAFSSSQTHVTTSFQMGTVGSSIPQVYFVEGYLATFRSY